MKKLLAVVAVVAATVVLATAPAAAGTANTGTFGPADEPTWVLPLVGVFILLGIVFAIRVARHDTDV